MLKNIVKLSILFCIIFTAFLFLFVSSSKAAYQYTCACFNRKTENFEVNSFEQVSIDKDLSLKEIESACYLLCSKQKDSWGDPMYLGAYKKQNGSVINVGNKPTEEQFQSEFTENCYCDDSTIDGYEVENESECKATCTDSGSTMEKFTGEPPTKPTEPTEPTEQIATKENCTCTADNKKYIVESESSCSDKCIGSSYEFTGATAEGVCACSDGNTYSGTDCTSICSKKGLTATDQKATGQDQAVSSQSCVCKDDAKSEATDEAYCTTFCGNGHGGVKSYIPPVKGAEESSKTSIKNPLTGINEPKDLIKKIINYALGIVGALAVLIIIYSGFVYMTSRGNEKQIESAKNSLTYAIIGLVVIFASIIIVNAVISAIGGG